MGIHAVMDFETTGLSFSPKHRITNWVPSCGHWACPLQVVTFAHWLMLKPHLMSPLPCPAVITGADWAARGLSSRVHTGVAKARSDASGAIPHHPCDSNSFIVTLFKTAAQVSQSASSTLLYFASNGFRVAVVRSMS